MWDPTTNADNAIHLSVYAVLVPALVVDPHTCSWTGRAEPVDTNPRADFVSVPGIRIRPVVQLLVDPGQKAGRTIGEIVPDGLWFDRLDDAVAPALLEVSRVLFFYSNR